MALSLFNLGVNSYLQTLGSVSGFLDKGLAYFRENGIDPDSIVTTSLHPDMKPFNFQVQTITHHSVGGLDAIKDGVYYATLDAPSRTYSELQTMILDAQAIVQKATPEDVNGREDKDVLFRYQDFTMSFTAENFLLTFSLPNVNFHAATVYGMLRAKGVPLGKNDYLGQMRLKV